MFEYERARRKEESVEQSMGPVMCDPRSLIEGLNPQQEEAVKYYGQALLIGAGAGSGKTRVLTRRIAWLLAHGFWASSILAITFTNKAAAEMRERLVTLVGPEAEHMWISTFHSACVRILRRDGKEIGLKSGFSIYDTADSERLVKLIAADLNIDTKRYTPRMLLGKISDCKNALVFWKDQLKKANCDYTPGQRGYQVSAGDVDELVAVVYAEYQHRLALANAVDFDDLIMRTVELLQTCPQVSEYYRHRFRYIFVDEYQDTNHAQYVLVRELSGIDSDEQPDPQARGAGRVGPSWITVVGDSDQSIYAFRGADIRNIQDFEQDFPNAKTIMLEQNYRSTQTILDAANAVIAKNENRKPKKLWTALGQGDKIVGYAADNAQQEGGSGRSLQSAIRECGCGKTEKLRSRKKNRKGESDACFRKMTEFHSARWNARSCSFCSARRSGSSRRTAHRTACPVWQGFSLDMGCWRCGAFISCALAGFTAAWKA